MQHLSWRHLSISAISQLLLAWFWPNFKGRFLGPFWTYHNYHNDICPGNISSCNICPCQEYLSCHWPDFDQILKVGSWDLFEHIPTVTMTFVQATLVLATFVHIYLSCYVPGLDQILKVGSWDLFEHVPTVTMTFVQSTLVLATFVHIKNIPAVTDLILTKL